MTEVYKDVIGYEGLYQVSNKGNVKSLNFNGKKGFIKDNLKGGNMKKDNKNRNSSRSKVEQEDLLNNKFVIKHQTKIYVTYHKSSEITNYINNEEGC